MLSVGGKREKAGSMSNRLSPGGVCGTEYPPGMQFSRRRSGAFTMVEMAVVMALLAVLATLIFPALTGAAERGRRAACTSNLRNMGTSFGLYASDNDGWLPQHVGGFEGVTAPTTTAWYGHLLWGSNQLWNHGQLLPYLMSPEIYWCPSQTGRLGSIDVSRKSNKSALLVAGETANSEYLYRKEWYDRYPRYRMAPLVGEGFCILADHFWGNAGKLAVETGHQDGYNVLRVGGNVFFFEHPVLGNGKLDPSFTHTPGASSESEWKRFDSHVSHADITPARTP